CWQGDAFIDDNTLAVNIARLRKKLKTVGYDELIQTKKGIGYYLK
ncbi:MAG: winged helix-turn-helix domain-containing protein, partial [Lactobacillus iners]|nr:winged helix-turn-helix domain-containing protein [Lactobacillus iners]